MAWVKACEVADLSPGNATVLPVTPPVAVFNVDGEFLATADTCTHAESSLADGYIDGDVVECALHFAKFCLRTGDALSRPAAKPLAVHPVKVVDGEVFVDVGQD